MIEQIKNVLRPVKHMLIKPDTPPPRMGRELIAIYYLHGEGIEIGALHNPLKVPDTVKVRYVDRMSVANLRTHYPELANLPLVPIDIVDDGERLQTLKAESQDFVIANHFLEHCQDPIATLHNLMRVLKPGGVLYLAVPEKRSTFDCHRPVTPLAHLQQDHQNGPEGSRETHFREWAEHVSGMEGDAIERMAQELMQKDYSIHFHVWTSATFSNFLYSLQEELNCEIQLIFQQNNEVITILTKHSQEQDKARAAIAQDSLRYARSGG